MRRSEQEAVHKVLIMHRSHTGLLFITQIPFRAKQLSTCSRAALNLLYLNLNTITIASRTVPGPLWVSCDFSVDRGRRLVGVWQQLTLVSGSVFLLRTKAEGSVLVKSDPSPSEQGILQTGVQTYTGLLCCLCPGRGPK